MEPKKSFASFMDGTAPASSSSSMRPLSPFRSARISIGGASRRNSHATTSSTYSASDPNPALLSCVTKETSQDADDCAQHRFIVWAAVKRNSSTRMTAEEKLECPLLRCTQRLPNHESMLKHLAGCPHLASGEYWCYDHMRIERFDDLKCKRCLGHPSRRKKMLSMAKNFFHLLGQKSRKGQGLDDEVEETLIPPPPSYGDTLDTVLKNSHELSGNEIVEIDSTEVMAIDLVPTVVAPAEVVNPRELLIPSLPIPSLPELDSTRLAPESDSFMTWQPTTTVDGLAVPFISCEAESRNPFNRPSLQLNTYGLQGFRPAPRPLPTRPISTATRSKVLSPSSSVRSNASTDSTDSNVSAASDFSTTSNNSSLVSPISNYSGPWSMPSDPATGIASPGVFLGPDGLLPGSFNACPADPTTDMVYSNIPPEFFELPADQPTTTKCPEDTLNPDSTLFSFDAFPTMELAYATDIVLSEGSSQPVNFETTSSGLEEAPMVCSETRSLVVSAWEALQGHMVSSMLKIQSVKGNSLADQLRSMSPRTVATLGLETLRSLLGGTAPTTAIDALCFVHLVYTFSLVLHGQYGPRGFQELFLQSLAYTNSLPSPQRDSYASLVLDIWQPADLTQAVIANHSDVISCRTPSRSSSLKGKQPAYQAKVNDEKVDTLLVAALNFLDELEGTKMLSRASPHCSVPAVDPGAKPLSGESVLTISPCLMRASKFVSQSLLREFLDETGLAIELDKICRRVACGEICSPRGLEIGFFQAAEGCMTLSRFFGAFVPRLRKLCDPVYEQLGEGVSRRLAHYESGIRFIQHVISELDKSVEKPGGNMICDDLDEFLNNLDLTFADSEGMGSTSIGFSGFSDVDNSLSVPEIRATSAGPSRSNSRSSHHDEKPKEPEATGATKEASEGEATSKVEADARCDICGYRPKGDPQWFKGSMAKHKKLQHSKVPPKIYECPFPGCNSRYKSRPDNLRQHQIDKNHWGPGEDSSMRRPSKRKKIAQDGE